MGIKEKIKELNQKTFSIADIINILLYMILCIMPLVLGSSGIDKYYQPKAIFLQVVGGIIFLLMIKEKVRLVDKTDKLIMVFLVIATLSLINSSDIKRSLFGGTLRYEGLITLFMYGVIFIAAKKYFRLSKIGIKLFMGSGLIVSIYYIIQKQGFEPLRFFLGDSIPRNTTIGNQNFVSSYMIIFLALSICIFIFWGNKKSYICMCFYFIALIYSNTRGGWVTLPIFCLVGLLFIYRDKEKMKRAVAIVISFIVIFGMMNILNNSSFLNRLETIEEDITELDKNAGSGRIGIYIGTIESIKANPILGTGVSCLWDGFKEHTPKDILNDWTSQNIMVDKAHNEILNIAGTMGILNAIVYIILVFLVFKNIWKNIKDDKFKTIFIILFGYVVQANLNISVVPVAPLFWIILGIGANSKIIESFKIEEKTVIS